MPVLLDVIAPWIIESWREALEALVFDIPVLPLDALQAHLLIATTSLLLLMMAHASLRPVPVRARLPAVMLIGGALLIPVGNFAYVQSEALRDWHQRFADEANRPAVEIAAGTPVEQSAPGTALGPPAAGAPTVAAPVATAPAPSSTLPVVEVAPAQPALSKPEVPLPPAAPVVTAAAEPPAAMAVDPGAQPSPSHAPATGAASSVRRLARQLSKLVARGPETEVIPVFFGTDRAVDQASPRLDYTADRAGRLELGRALVAVPRRHVRTSDDPGAVSVKVTVKDGPAGVDPNVHFTIAQIEALGHDAFLEAAVRRLFAAQRHQESALVFVPGFNTTFDAAVFRAAQIAYDLRFDGPVFVYSWPSAGHAPRYTYDRESVAQAERHFAEFLRVALQQTKIKSVNVIAAGLGSALTLNALVRHKTDLLEGVRLDELLLSAPDIDRPTFATQARALAGSARGITVYAASTDRALNVARRFTGGVPRAGDVLEGGPLVLDGVRTIDISALGTETLALNHRTYVESGALTGDMAARLAGLPVIPGTAKVENVAAAGGSYLRYLASPRVQ